MNDLYKWIEVVSKNFEFQPDEVVMIDKEYGGGVGRFVRLGVDGSTAILDVKGNLAEFPLDNLDRAVAGEENIYDEPETHRYSDFQADSEADVSNVEAHELNDKPELLPGDMVEVEGAFGAGNGKGCGVFMGYSLDGATALVNIDSEVRSYPVELVSISDSEADAEEFASTGNDGALSPLSLGDQNKLNTRDETNGENNITINVNVSDDEGRSEPKNSGDTDMQNENMGMDKLLSIVERGSRDEEIVEAAAKCCDACKGGDCDGKCCDDSKCGAEVDECNEGKECTCESYDCKTCFPIDLSGITEKFDFVRDVVNKGKDDDKSDDDDDKSDKKTDEKSDKKTDDDDDDDDCCNESLTEGVIGGMAPIPDMTNASIACEGEDWYQNYMKLAEEGFEPGAELEEEGFEPAVEMGRGDGNEDMIALSATDEFDGEIDGMPHPGYKDVSDDTSNDDEIYNMMLDIDQSDASKWNFDQLMKLHDKGKDELIRKWHAGLSTPGM